MQRRPLLFGSCSGKIQIFLNDYRPTKKFTSTVIFCLRNQRLF